MNREAHIGSSLRKALLQACKRPTTRPLTAPYKRGRELPGIAGAYTTIVGQRLCDSAKRLGRQDLIPRSAQLVQQCDGGGALRQIQFAIAHKSSEGAAGFDCRPPPSDHSSQLGQKPAPLRGR